jgi:Cu-processing system permease protein
MRAIWIIAINTFREIIRDRILYGIFVFAVLLIGLSLVLGKLSFAEQARITTSFGLSAIQLSAVVLSIFLGSTLVTREIDKKTIMTLLVRPITRLQFLLGKAMGLLLVQLIVMLALSVVLTFIYTRIRVDIQMQFLVALLGVLLEAFVLLGLALFFSIFSSPAMVVAFTMGFFLIGHWLDSLSYFTKKEVSWVMTMLGQYLPYALPNLEHFNWRSAVIYSDPISSATVGWASLYCLAWFSALIAAATFIFRRRDFA